MSLIIDTILLVVLIAYIIVDIKKIKSDKKLSIKLDEMKETFKVPFDCDHLSKEIIKSINKQHKSNGKIKINI